MTEFPNLRQESTGFRRLFFDNCFELYLWYESEGGPLIGFQLVYDKSKAPHSLTWLEGRGYSHNAIDDGDVAGGWKKTPVLVPDGLFDSKNVLTRFEKASDGVPRPELGIVLEKLREFSHSKINPFL